MLTENQITKIFAPHLVIRHEFLAKGGRLVHYTNAESALKIIDSQQFWLRNSQLMNDFSEIQHGMNCLQAAWDSGTGKMFQEFLDKIKSGLSKELFNIFNGHADGFRHMTFIASFSEHDDTEDVYGRLSMWRAYGGRMGVALIMNSTGFTSKNVDFKVQCWPVFYHSIKSFGEWFESWVNDIMAAGPDLHNLSAVLIKNTLFALFRTFVLCIKHPAFAEEREWRLFYSPAFEGETVWIEESTEIIDKLPQHVMKFHLKDDLEKNITGISPATLFNRVLIGPCQSPVPVCAAITNALAKAGVENAALKMGITAIPYRH